MCESDCRSQLRASPGWLGRSYGLEYICERNESNLEDLAQYFHNHVIRSVKAFFAAKSTAIYGRGTLREAALTCAGNLYHFREYIPVEIRKSRDQVSAFCRSYKLLGDAYNAAKHMELTKTPADGPLLVKSSSEVNEEYVTIAFNDVLGEYLDSELVVNAQCADGENRLLDIALVEVMNYWISELRDLQLGDFVEWEVPKIPSNNVRPRSEARAQKIEAVSDFGLSIQFREFVYNYQTFQPELRRRLPGERKMLEIHTLPYRFVSNLSYNKKGQKISIQLPMSLSDDLSRLYFSFNPQGEDREKLLKHIFKANLPEILKTIEPAILRSPESGNELSLRELSLSKVPEGYNIERGTLRVQNSLMRVAKITGPE